MIKLKMILFISQLVDKLALNMIFILKVKMANSFEKLQLSKKRRSCHSHMEKVTISLADISKLHLVDESLP